MAIWLDSDNPLDRLLNGNPLESFPNVPKKTGDSLFKPTPFVPTKEEYSVTFVRQRCALCNGTTMSFQGYFVKRTDKDNNISMKRVEAYEVSNLNRKYADQTILDEITPTCFACSCKR